MVNVVLFIDALFVIAFALVLIPLWLVSRDVRKTLRRYGFQGQKERSSLAKNKESLYLQAAEAAFAKSPDTAIFIYGHTRQPSLTQLNVWAIDRYVLNTGSWLKKL